MYISGLSGFFQHSRHKEYFLDTDTETTEHLETLFCYVVTLLLWNVQKSCSMKNVPECKNIEEFLEK